MSIFKVVIFGNKSFSQLFRYAIVGLVVNAFGYLSYLLLTSTGFTPKIAMTALYGASVVIGFLGNNKFTFSHAGGVFGAGFRYGIAHLFGYLLNLLILAIFVDVYKCPHTIVQGVAIFIVAGFLFLCFKFFVFESMPTGKPVDSAVEHL